MKACDGYLVLLAGILPLWDARRDWTVKLLQGLELGNGANGSVILVEGGSRERSRQERGEGGAGGVLLSTSLSTPFQAAEVVWEQDPSV